MSGEKGCMRLARLTNWSNILQINTDPMKSQVGYLDVVGESELLFPDELSELVAAS